MTKKLISKLYYKLVNEDNKSVSQDLDFINIKSDGSYKGVSALLMTDNIFKSIPESRIIFEGKRVKNTNKLTGIKNKQYIERFFIRDKYGNELEASTVYDDEGSGFATEIPEVNYLVLSGNGKFKHASEVKIIFDNEGTIFGDGQKKVREVYIYCSK